MTPEQRQLLLIRELVDRARSYSARRALLYHRKCNGYARRRHGRR